MRTDVAFACEQLGVSERRACKLMGMDRGSYRYEPRPDRNASLREALVELARQKPRYGYRRPPPPRCLGIQPGLLADGFQYVAFHPEVGCDVSAGRGHRCMTEIIANHADIDIAP